MGWFQLDPSSILARVRNSSIPVHPPTLGESVLRGIVGFTVVSVAGFSPWAIFGRWFHGRSETDLYLACTAVFVGLSGIFLHRLIIGPGSLRRFYPLFTLAFIGYAVAWIVFWMGFRSYVGEVDGLLAGTAVMGAILAMAFDARAVMIRTILALFVSSLAGYYLGARIEGKLAVQHQLVAMLLWSICYGVGFGAGLGIAFHLCQREVRAALRDAAAGPRP